MLSSKTEHSIHRRMLSAPDIDNVSDRLAVGGIAAPAVAAGMVERHPSRNRADQPLIEQPVNLPVPALIADAAITLGREWSRPAPAPVWELFAPPEH